MSMYYDNEGIGSLYLNRMELRGFKGFEEATLDFHPQLTVLTGVNGSGKTTVLNALALGLTRIASRIQNPKATGRSIQEPDINHLSAAARLYFEMTFDKGIIVSWDATRQRPYRSASLFDKENGTLTPKGVQYIGLNEWIQHIHHSLEEYEGDFPIPVFAYYGANRAALDIPLRIRKRHDFSVKEANEGALDTGTTNFRTFFEWYRNREDLENELRLERSGHLIGTVYTDPQLEAVRKVIEAFLGFTNLKVRRSPLRMVLKKPGHEKEFTIDQLSDGEKGVLALFGDLARRLAIANPTTNSPLEGKAIVLIDEIDLHLHPRWQREVINKLPSLFPNCQFILTTHSPQILGEIPAGQIRMLRDSGNGGIQVLIPDYSKGLTSNSILKELMGASDRAKSETEMIEEIKRLIASDQYNKALTVLSKYASIVGESEPKAVELRNMIHFLTLE